MVRALRTKKKTASLFNFDREVLKKAVWSELPKIPVSPSNARYLKITEIADDSTLAVIPEYKIVYYRNAILSSINHVFVKSRYVPTGLVTSYDDKKLPLFKSVYLFLKSRFLDQVQYHQGEFLFAHDIWSNNYYHWLCEVLPRLLIMHKSNPQSLVILPSALMHVAFVAPSLELLGLKYKWIDTGVSHSFSTLVTVQCSPPSANVNPVLQHSLKSDLLMALNLNQHKKAWRKIYISREKASYRKIDNEQQIIPLLVQYGYEIIYAESLSYQKQIELFNETAYCIALHGAGLTNCMFMPPGSSVMEIRISAWSKQPLCYWRLANLFDLNWSYHLASSTAEESNFNNITIDYESFCADLNAFHKLN